MSHKKTLFYLKKAVKMRHKRDNSTSMHYRFMEFSREAQVENGMIKLTASTDAPVRFGSYREILMHGSENVDAASCRAILINHDANQLAGAIRSVKFDGHQCEITAEISPDARMQTGVKVRDAIRDGSLRGVSIGYDYDPNNPDECTYDEKERCITVKRWLLREATLTPIPRDTDAMVRTFDSLKQRHAAGADIKKKERTMDPVKLAALYAANPKYIDLISQRIAGGETDISKIEAAIIAAKATGDESARAATIALERDTLKRESQITLLAESHGLRASDYRAEPTLEAAITRMVKDKAKTEQDAQGNLRLAPNVTVTADAQDKFNAAHEDAMLSRACLQIRKEGFNGPRPYEQVNKDLGARSTFTFNNTLRQCAMRAGERDAWKWGGQACAEWFARMPKLSLAVGRDTEHFRAANQAFGQFPGILANVLDKAVALGFQGFENITYPMWTRPRPVDDFKPFLNAALTLGNLALTTENVAFPELTAKDMSYTNALGMWGGTLTLTYQAMVSDDLGEFFRVLGQAGMIAQRTVDRQVYITLINGPGATTYSGSTGWNTTALQGVDNITSVPLATQNNLDTVRNAFRKKINMAGEFMGNSPKWLLHPIPLSQAADRATGRAQPPGEQSYLASNKARTLETLEVNYLDDPSITGNSAAAYYLVGDSSVDTLVVATLAGMQVPQVMEFDPGATADRKFKVMYPFVPFIPVYTDGTSIHSPTSPNIANRPIGITRGTG
jgi:phage head maturation protease